jgi:hypothetical protein
MLAMREAACSPRRVLRHALAPVALSLALACLASPASAAPPPTMPDAGRTQPSSDGGPGPKTSTWNEGKSDDVDELLRTLQGDAKALATDDCGAACKALASMRRAADRICALDDAGRRCADARSTVEEASRRVRAACPDCAIASVAPPAPEVVHADAKPQAAPPEPASEPARGGCAGCGGGGGSSSRGGSAGYAIAVIWAISRIGRKKRP